MDLYFTLSPLKFSKEIIQSKILSISLWNCILHSSCRVFKRDNFSLKYIPYPCKTVFYNSPSGVFSIRDNNSQKYIPYPCGTVFYNPPVEFSIIDTYSKLKYTPYPCGTTCILHSPLWIFQQEIITV